MEVKTIELLHKLCTCMKTVKTFKQYNLNIGKNQEGQPCENYIRSTSISGHRLRRMHGHKNLYDR